MKRASHTGGRAAKRATGATEHAEREAARAQPRGAPLVPEQAALIALQQAAGNRAVAGALQDGGQPLDPATRAQMERSFGQNFAEVRVHADGAGDATARAHAARAVTVGHEVAFRAGEYAPGTLVGERLIAHELAHVVQQRRGGEAPPSPASGGGAVLEGGARAAADAVTAGRPVSVSGASAPGAAAETFEDQIAKQLGVTLKSAEAAPAPQKPAYLGPKLAPDQEWAAQALGLDVKAGKGPAERPKAGQLEHLAPPAGPAPGPKKPATDAAAAEKARWKGIPAQLKPMLDELHVSPESWKQMVDDLTGLPPEMFRLRYKIDDKLYQQLRNTVSDAYRDPANFTPLPKDLDGPIRSALGVGPQDVIPQAKLDVMAEEEASMARGAFQKKYHLTPEQQSALSFWLRKSHREIARKTDAKVMAYDGTILNESEYDNYMLRKRIEAVHAPSGVGAVASVVARAFTDDENIIAAVSATGDLVETGLSGVAARGSYPVAPSGGSRPGMTGGANERSMNEPRPAMPRSGSWTPPPTRTAPAAPAGAAGAPPKMELGPVPFSGEAANNNAGFPPEPQSNVVHMEDWRAEQASRAEQVQGEARMAASDWSPTVASGGPPPTPLSKKPAQQTPPTRTPPPGGPSRTADAPSPPVRRLPPGRKPPGQRIRVAEEPLPEGTHGVSKNPPGSKQQSVGSQVGNWSHENFEKLDKILLPQAESLTSGKLPAGLKREVEVPVPELAPGKRPRMDRLDEANAKVIEIKPDGLRQQGLVEAQGYAEQMNRYMPRADGRKWVGEVVTYNYEEVEKFLRKIGFLPP